MYGSMLPCHFSGILSFADISIKRQQVHPFRETPNKTNIYKLQMNKIHYFKKSQASFMHFATAHFYTPIVIGVVE